MEQTGFILTRQFHDRPDGGMLTLWVKTDTGAQRLDITEQKPVFFIRQAEQVTVTTLLDQAPAISHEIKPLKLTTLSHEPAAAIYFTRQRDLYEASERLSEANIEALESDVRVTERFMMERFIRAGIRWHYTNEQQLHIQPSYYQPQFNVVSLDIETSYNSNDLYCIGLTWQNSELVLMCGKGTNTETVTYYPNERKLLRAFSNWVAQHDPDIFIGWNVINFDFRFLQKKYEQYGMRFDIGRQKEAVSWRQSNDGQQNFMTIPGRLALDGIDGHKAATYHFESFSLEFVARELLGVGKQIDDVSNRGPAIKKLYHDNPAALAEYNLQDCRLVQQIFDHTKVLDYLIERAYLTGLPLDKYGGSTASFDNLYLPLLHRSGYVAPDYGSGLTGLNAPGGYVMDSLPGLYEHVLVLDFKSLYPSIIRTFFIDPMGLSEGLKTGESPSTLEGFNGGIFHREKHHLPGLIQTLWAARDEAKKDNNAAVSQAIKIIMNSFYGVLGSPGCRFFDQRLSSSITLRGHEILQKSKDWIEQHGYQVIYGDTDSVFVWLNQKCTNNEAKVIGESLQQGLNHWWTEELRSRYQIDSQLEIEFETHYSRFFMPTIRGSDKGSKKRYCGLIQFEDGTDKMIFKGLESVRTDWTPLARRFQQTLYRMIFDNKDWTNFLRKTVEQLQAGELDSELIYRKRLRRKLADYQRNVPPHVQAARKADQWLLQKGEQARYQNGGWIHYVITLNGPEPIECLGSAYDYQHYIDRQLAPIADAILPLLGHRFDEYSQPQIGLF